MTKFSKGTKVYFFCRYNQDTYVYRTCEVKSCGKIRMTLESTENGKMIKSFVSANAYDMVIPVADMADPVAHAEKLAAEYIQHMIDFNITHRVGHPCYHQEGIRETIEKFRNAVARGTSYEIRCAETAAEIRAKYG